MCTILLAAALSLPLCAQDAMQADTTALAPIESARWRGAREATPEEKEYARLLAEQREQEQIDRNLPLVTDNGQVVTPQDAFHMPFGWGWNDWRLHRGLNVNVGASVFASFGGGHGHGAGFTQDVSLMYVTNLSPKLTLAVGGYLNSMQYSGDQYTTAGITALLGYRINEHWSAYAFAQKAFVSDNVQPAFGRGFYGAHYGIGYMGSMGMGYGWGGYDSRMMDRIGAGVRYEWGNHNSIEISVEVDHMPNNGRYTYDTRRYDYPVR